MLEPCISHCRAGIVFSLAILLLGCSGGDRPPLAEVEGTILLNGKPLQNAHVVFHPNSGYRASTGLTDESGNFRLVYLRDIPGAVVGQHTVRIRRLPAEEFSVPPNPLPAKYNEASELIANVQRGKNVIDFQLPTH